MLKANAGFVKFTPPPADPVTGVRPTVSFSVGMSTPFIPAAPGYMPDPFTAFQCAVDPDGSLLYDTVVYICNRNPFQVAVDAKITNGENGQIVYNSPVYIEAWHLRAFSLAGALK